VFKSEWDKLRRYMLTDKELEHRKKFIGGSECAAVLGLSRYATPLSVWAEKLGKLPQEDISKKLHIKMGNRLEEVVAELFTEETGKAVRRVNETFYHPKYPFLGANIDRRVVGEDAILECKTASGWMAKDWQGSEVPTEYILQCLHYLAVTGKKEAYIAVLIGGNQDFIWKKVERDEKLIADIVKKEVAFWNNFILTGEMPVQITKDDADTLYGLYPLEEEGKTIELDDKANILCESLQAMNQDIKVLAGNIDRTKNEIRALLKDNEVGQSPNWKVTWKAQVSKGLDTKRIKDEEPGLYEKYPTITTSRVLRIKSLIGKVVDAEVK